MTTDMQGLVLAITEGLGYVFTFNNDVFYFNYSNIEKIRNEKCQITMKLLRKKSNEL